MPDAQPISPRSRGLRTRLGLPRSLARFAPSIEPDLSDLETAHAEAEAFGELLLLEDLIAVQHADGTATTGQTAVHLC